LKRDEFEHVIRAAADVVDDELVVIGSQAVLAQFPDAPDSLLTSLEVDMYPRTSPDRAREIDGAIGDGSRFHETYDYYAHGVGPETAKAPAGWENRLVRLEVPKAVGDGTAVAWCLEVHDLVLAKLAAGRPHDHEYSVEALRAGLVDPQRLELGIDLMPEETRDVTRERLAQVIERSAVRKQSLD
jgi:hypothetical protein